MAVGKYRSIVRNTLRDITETKTSAVETSREQQRARADLRALQVEIGKLREEVKKVREEVTLRPEIAAVNFAAFDRYRDAFAGRDVVIAASGPTLAHYEPIEGAIHIGVNSVIADTRIPLDFAFVQDFVDRDGSSLHGDDLFARTDCTYFFGVVAHVWRYKMIEASHSITARVGATRYFKEHSPSSSIEYDIRFNPLVDFFTVVFPALHFALFTNPRRIYLAGCDTTYFGHFDGTPQPGTGDQIRPHLIPRLIGYRKMRDFARRVFPDTEIISINPVTLAGLFTDQFTPGVEYRTSAAQPALAAAGFTDQAIVAYVEEHIAEIGR